MNLWLQSLKKFNDGKQMWCIPRKGSDMYDVVRNVVSRSVSLPLDEFTREHARLISTLKNPTPQKLKEEAARQAKELAKELRGRRPPPKKKVSVKVSL